MSEEIKDIRIVPESECCGCAACANACPVDAIRMEEGKEGFVFPKVDLNTCIPVSYTHLFNTFFNSFSIGKWRKYTVFNT